VNALERNRTTFLGAQRFGDLLPGPPVLPLFANELHEWFQPAMVRATAAAFGAVRFYFVVHGVHCFSITAYAETSGTH